MRDLNDLYKKEADGAAPAPGTEAPILETPPGLPQEYIDINLKNQPLPAVIDMSSIAQEEEKDLNFRRVPGGESMCHVTNIPYRPGIEPRIVQDRIDQGPRVFASRVQRDQFEKDRDEKEDQSKARPKGPTLPHPDTLKPGTFITGESKVYRPV
jgi:hypothetical protein